MSRAFTLQDLQAHGSPAQSGAQKNADQFGPGRTLADTPESNSTPEATLGATAHPSGPGRTLAGTPESTSTPEPSLGETTHPSGPGRTLTSTLEPISTLEALGETAHPGQQNGSERLANLPSESHLLGSVRFGDKNKNCGNTTGSYNNTTNNNTTDNSTNTITNNAEKIYGGGTHNTISGTFS